MFLIIFSPKRLFDFGKLIMFQDISFCAEMYIILRNPFPLILRVNLCDDDIVGDLGDLAFQTAQFAQKLNKNSRGASPDTPLSTSRSSSYSSVVSAGTGSSNEQRSNRPQIPRLGLNMDNGMKKNNFNDKHPG